MPSFPARCRAHCTQTAPSCTLSLVLLCCPMRYTTLQYVQGLSPLRRAGAVDRQWGRLAMNKGKAALVGVVPSQPAEALGASQGRKGPGSDWRAAYERPEDDRARTYLRQNFLQAVRHHAPEVLADLAGEPLARYRPVQQFDRDDSFSHKLELEADILHHPLFQPFWESLRAWGHRWNLVADWCLQRALLTLRQWTRWPEGVNQDGWGNMGIR